MCCVSGGAQLCVLCRSHYSPLGLLTPKSVLTMQAIVRGVCAIIDAFHFDVASHVPAQTEGPEGQGQAEGPEGQGQAGGPEGQGQAEEGLHDHAEAESACQAEAESAHKEIQSALTRRVLPGLRAQLVHDGEVSCHMQDPGGSIVLQCPKQEGHCSSPACHIQCLHNTLNTAASSSHQAVFALHTCHAL